MQKSLITLTAFLFVIFTSCHDIEKKSMNNTNAQTLLTESVTAYSIFSLTQEEATRTGLKFEATNKSALLRETEYPVITVEPLDFTSWPKTITVDYGTENHAGIDGHMRRGVMVITAQNFPSTQNAAWVVTFDEYFLDDFGVEGTQTVKYKGLNASSHPEYDCTVSDGVITSPEGKIFRFEQHATREWIAGYDTRYVLSGNIEDLCDDQYLISGDHSGISSDGYVYNMSTTEPLQVNLCCKWIVDGKIMVELPDADLNCEIDYRPGYDTGEMCNNLASFLIFGNTIPITLN